jgi:DNA-binding Xre family transcriptional regulator
MSISYKKLWKLIIDKDLKKSDVKKQANISASTSQK